jgi:hypothetical protein
VGFRGDGGVVWLTSSPEEPAKLKLGVPSGRPLNQNESPPLNLYQWPVPLLKPIIYKAIDGYGYGQQSYLVFFPGANDMDVLSLHHLWGTGGSYAGLLESLSSLDSSLYRSS